MNDIYYFEILGNGNSIRIELLNVNDEKRIGGNIYVKGGAFSGKFNADFLTSDFPSFKTQLEKLYDKLTGVATFYTIENQVNL